MLDNKLFQVVKDVLNEDYIFEYPEDFKKRMIVQKTLYLLFHGKNTYQIRFPYKWSFYIRGPYSSDIAHMMYYMAELDPNEFGDEKLLSFKEIEKIQEYKKFKNDIERFKQNRINEEDLEVLATLTYIGSQLGENGEKIIKKFYDHKPELADTYKPEKLSVFCALLSEYGFI